MAERFQRRYGLNQTSSSGAEQMHATIANQFGGFKSSMGSLATNLAEKQGIAKAEKAAKVYDPTTTPELSDRGNRAAKVYNNKVLQAHQQAVDVRYKQRLIELSDEFKDDPESFDAAANKRFQMLKGELHPDLHAKLPIYDHMRFVESRNLREAFKTEREAEAVATANNWVDSTSSSILRRFRNGDDELGLQELESFKQELLGTTVFEDADKVKISDTIDRLVIENVTTHEIDQYDPVTALKKIDELRGEVPEQFTPDQWDTYIGKVTTRQNARYSTANKKREDESIALKKEVSDLEIAINLMDEETDLDTISGLSEQVEGLFDKGMSSEKRTSLTVKIAQRQKQIDEDQRAIAGILQRLEGDDSIVINQSKVDDLWPKIEKTLLSDDPLTRNAQISEMATRLDYIPRTVKSQVSNDLRSLDTDTLFNALDLMDRLQDKKGLPDAFSEEELAYASQLQSLLAYLPPEKAIEKALHTVNPDNTAMIDGRRDFIDGLKQRKKLDFHKEAGKRFDGFGFDLDDLNHYQLTADFENMVDAYYVAGMDFGEAKDQAERDIKNAWGVDGVTDRLMKYPVQNFYAVNGKVDWVQRQLEREVAEVAPFNKVYLTSDNQTEREASAGRPSYLVWGVTDSGIEPLGLRFTPDMEGQKEKVRKANREKLEKGRQHVAPGQSLKDVLIPPAVQEFLGEYVVEPVVDVGMALTERPRIAQSFKKKHGRYPTEDEIQHIMNGLAHADAG